MAEEKPPSETSFVFPTEGTPYQSNQPAHQYVEHSPEQRRNKPVQANEAFSTCPIPKQAECKERFPPKLFPEQMLETAKEYTAVQTPPPSPMPGGIARIYSDTMPSQKQLIQDYEFDYPMPRNFPRGIGMIFINKSFPDVPNRPGTQKDRENFELIFAMMGLKILLFEDNSYDEISRNLNNFEKEFSNTSVYLLCVAFSTHGHNDDTIYCSDGLHMSLRNDIFPIFKPDKCPSLRGIPKVFIVQACRGEIVDRLHSQVEADAMVKDDLVSLESDFLISYACPPKHKAFRSEEEGAWFLAELSKACRMYSTKYHFLDILTITNQLLLKRACENLESGTNVAQPSHIDSTLKKFIWLKSENFVTSYNELDISSYSIPYMDLAPKAMDDYKDKSEKEQPNSGLKTPTNSLPITANSTAGDLSGKAVYDYEEPRRVLGELMVENGIYLKTPKCDYLQSYDLGKGEFKGLGIIIVNHKCGSQIRNGSQTDLENFKYLFEGLNLKIVVAENLNAQKKGHENYFESFIENTINDNLEMNSFFLAISTHGIKGARIIGADGMEIEVDSILELFNKLIGKPKIAIIQACRGTKQEEIYVCDAPQIATQQSDLLVAFSCVEGFQALRGSEGSWFTKSLRECYDLLRGRSNILELLIATNRYLLDTYTKNNGFIDVKQTAEFRNTLTCILKI